MTKPLLIVTVGLPRAGKSSWATRRSLRYGIPVVGLDAIRLARKDPTFSAEAFAKSMVRALFLAGHGTVIVDATHITRKRRAEWKSRQWTTRFKVFATPMDECIRRARQLDQAHLVPVIERLAAEFEPLGKDEIPLESRQCRRTD